MYQAAKTAIAAVLWTAAIALGAAGTLEEEPHLRFWALMVALAACLLVGHLIIIHAVHAERVRIEHLMDGLIAGARERVDAGDVTRLR